MTQDELVARYQVIRDVSDGSPGRLRTLLAWPQVGEKVLIHYLEGPPAEDARVFALIERLTPPDRAMILERLVVDGRPVVITKFLEKRRTLRQWLEITVDPAPAQAPGTIDGAGGERDPSNDRTVVFVPKPSGDPPAEPRADPHAAVDGSTPLPTPGEFTQLFGIGSKGPEVRPVPKGLDWGTAPEVPDQPAARSPDPKPDPLGDAPGEMTRLFAGVVPRHSPEVRPDPQADPPGELTRLFAGVTPKTPSLRPVPKGLDQRAVPEPPKPKPAPSEAAPGELTRLFEGYVAPPDPPAQVRRPAPLEPEPDPHRIDWLGSEVVETPLFKSDPAPSWPVGDVNYLDRLAAPPRGGRPPSGPEAGSPPAQFGPEPFGVGEYPQQLPPALPPVPARIDSPPDDSGEADEPGGKAGYLIGLAVVVVVAIGLLILVLAR